METSKIVAILCRCVANTDLIVSSFMSDYISGTFAHVWWLGDLVGVSNGMLHVVNGISTLEPDTSFGVDSLEMAFNTTSEDSSKEKKVSDIIGVKGVNGA